MSFKSYFQLLSVVPSIASVALIALLWAQDGLLRGTPLFLAGWFLLALAAQYLGTTASMWAIGLASQTVLAIILLLKHRVGQL
jgi:hypothetical protein